MTAEADAITMKTRSSMSAPNRSCVVRSISTNDAQISPLRPLTPAQIHAQRTTARADAARVALEPA